MGLTKIDLCSRALVKVGANSITSFDDGTTEAEVAASLYSITCDAILSAHPWNFATQHVILLKLATLPLADFIFAFQIPLDCLRVLSAGHNGRGQGITYKIYKGQIYADTDEITITYISQLYEENFPPFFCMALISRLAAEFCIPLTDNTSRWMALQELAEAELRRAKLIDSQEDTPAAIADFTLIEGRY